MKSYSFSYLFLAAFILIISFGAPARGAQDGAKNDADLAQKLTNPIADLMMMPVQINYDHHIGADDDGERIVANFQPVIPFNLNDRWKLITRTIIPYVYQDDVVGTSSQSGLGDINMSLFLSPNAPGRLIWGVGTVLAFPTASDEMLGSEKWGAGPAGICLTMHGPWTLGMQANHLWSYAGDNDRSDVSSTLIQPFVAYTVSPWSYSLTTESTYDHEAGTWSIPVNFSVSKLMRWGRLPVNIQGGVGYWAKSPDTGAEDFRFRFQIKFILPK